MGQLVCGPISLAAAVAVCTELSHHHHHWSRRRRRRKLTKEDKVVAFNQTQLPINCDNFNLI